MSEIQSCGQSTCDTKRFYLYSRVLERRNKRFANFVRRSRRLYWSNATNSHSFACVDLLLNAIRDSCRNSTFSRSANYQHYDFIDARLRVNESSSTSFSDRTKSDWANTVHNRNTNSTKHSQRAHSTCFATDTTNHCRNSSQIVFTLRSNLRYVHESILDRKRSQSFVRSECCDFCKTINLFAIIFNQT
jgi:hypothetical protein